MRAGWSWRVGNEVLKVSLWFLNYGLGGIHPIFFRKAVHTPHHECGLILNTGQHIIRKWWLIRDKNEILNKNVDGCNSRVLVLCSWSMEVMCVFVIIWALLSHGATSQCTQPLFFYFLFFLMTAALRSTFVHQRCCTLRRDDLHWFSEGATCKQTTLGPFLNASFFFDVRTVLWSRVQMVVMWTMKEIQTITSQLWGERSSLSQSR